MPPPPLPPKPNPTQARAFSGPLSRDASKAELLRYTEAHVARAEAAAAAAGEAEAEATELLLWSLLRLLVKYDGVLDGR